MAVQRTGTTTKTLQQLDILKRSFPSSGLFIVNASLVQHTIIHIPFNRSSVALNFEILL